MPRHRRRMTKKTLTAAEVDAYANFLKGNTKIDVKRPAPSAYKNRDLIGIIPFESSPDTTSGVKNHVGVTMTRGAGGLITLLNLTGKADSVFGHSYDAAQIGTSDSGFYPAVCRLTLIPSGAVPDKTGVSAMTGRPRNYLPGRSGTIPFGRGTVAGQPDKKGKAQATIADIDYGDAVEAIRKEIGTAAGTAYKPRISFENEILGSLGKAPDVYVPSNQVAPAF